MIKKIIITLVLLGLFAGLGGGGYLYYYYRKANIKQSGKLYIPKGAGYAQLIDSLSPFLDDKGTFLKAAKFKRLSAHYYPGRYSLEKGMSNKDILQLLRNGKQDEIAIRIGNYHSIYQLAGRVSPFLQCDSSDIVKAIQEVDFAKDYNDDERLFFFIPDTYQFHWATSGTDFVKFMKSQYDRFWNQERLSAARERGFSPLEVTTLASIVQLESKHEDEQPLVAGLYLNRLAIDMKLDADPTIIYALKRARGTDEKITRVLYADLKINSPYNTYLYKGLPPSPICMPNPSAVKAVLHPAKHDFLFFVADPKRPGYHLFSRNLGDHEKNAAVYRQWIDSFQRAQRTQAQP